MIYDQILPYFIGSHSFLSCQKNVELGSLPFFAFWIGVPYSPGWLWTFYVVKNDVEQPTPLPPPLQCWDHRRESSHPVLSGAGMGSQGFIHATGSHPQLLSCFSYCSFLCISEWDIVIHLVSLVLSRNALTLQGYFVVLYDFEIVFLFLWGGKKSQRSVTTLPWMW